MDVALGYVSAQQNDYIDRLRIQTNVGVVDLQALGLLSTGGPGSPDPAVHAQAGAGADTNIGERLTVRAEVSVADHSRGLTLLIPCFWRPPRNPCHGPSGALQVHVAISTKTSLIVEYAGIPWHQFSQIQGVFQLFQKYRFDFRAFRGIHNLSHRVSPEARDPDFKGSSEGSDTFSLSSHLQRRAAFGASKSGGRERKFIGSR